MNSAPYDPLKRRGDCQSQTHLIFALLSCLFTGVLFSALPHFLSWVATGSPVWIADHDELLYLSFASQALFNHPTYLSDPLLAAGGSSIYPWIQFVPAILSAKLFALGPFGISLIWRIWAGLSIGMMWFSVIKLYIRNLWPATIIALIMLSDVGVLFASPVLRQLGLLGGITTGATDILSHQPQIHVEWRIITPGLSLAFLLLHVWLLARAREKPTRNRTVLAGIGYGLLFPVYFYYWTAATLALTLAWVLDRACRRLYFRTFCIGVLLGTPTVVSGLLLKRTGSSDWLHRSDNFLPIGHFDELLVPKVALTILGLLAFWAWRHKELIYVWCLVCSGVLLSNHQIITGLQVQNFHWVYVWGPCLSLLVVLAVWDALKLLRISHLSHILIGFCVIHFAAGLWLRYTEVTRTKESIQWVQDYRNYEAGRRARHLAANSVVSGPEQFVYLATIADNLRPLDHYCAMFSPAVSDRDLDQRVALNSFLEGLDKSAFNQQQQQLLTHLVWGSDARSVTGRNARLLSRLAAYDWVAANPEPAVRLYDVRYVAVNASVNPPRYIRSGWSRIEDGPVWQIWEHRPLIAGR
jgi:hypothetical protein